MSVRTILFLATLFFAGSTVAGQTDSLECSSKARLHYAIGLHTGLDIGAAVPFPLSAMGSDSKMNAVPVLCPQLGLSFTLRVAHRWTATIESTYKQVGIDAKARVSRQQFKDPDDPTIELNFRGSVEMGMRFSMLEIPIFVGYNLGGNEGRVLLGAYFSHIFLGRFNARPMKGVLSSPNDPNDTAEVYEPMDVQYFDNKLSNWDWGLLTGYEIKIFERATLSARLSMGMKDIFKPDAKIFDYKMLHMRGTVVFAYKLFRG